VIMMIIIVLEELQHVVALVNARTNFLFWVTKHVLKLEYVLTQSHKQGEQDAKD
jgi:hypothetical protein